MLINAITYIDEILRLEKECEKSNYMSITNVSYWNPSCAYKNYMQKYIKLDYQQDIFDYIYTYDLPKSKRKQIMQKLGVINPEDSMCLLTASGTSTILNVLYFLKSHDFKKIGILAPSYFSVEEGCKTYNLEYEKIMLQYVKGKYVIPMDYLIEHHFDAIWLTSPAYSTGISYDKYQIETLKKLISKKILIIADETLAMPDQMLISEIPIGDFFFSICCPHKPLFINKIKFSALICPKSNDDFLEQWVDIISGGLLCSNITAIQHFLSDNFSECVCATQRWYYDTIKEIHEVVRQFPHAICNLDEIAPYKTIYLDSPSKKICDLKNIKMLIDNEYVSYIPLAFEKNSGFRVNLSLKPEDLCNALYRILRFYT